MERTAATPAAAPLLTVNELTGSFSPWGVLKQQLVTDLVAEGVTGTIESSPQGGAGLDDVLAALAARTNTLPRWHIDVRSLIVKKATVSRVGPDRTAIVQIPTLSFTKLRTGGGMMSGMLTAKAAMFGAAEPNVELAGQVFFDTATSAASLRSARLTLMGSAATLDATIELAASPLKFEFHGASPDITAAQLATLFPSIENGFPAGIAVKGPVALDLYASGTRDATTIQLQAELTRAALEIGTLVKKSPGQALKVEFAGADQPAYLTINALNLRTGEGIVQIAGSLLHGPDHQAQLTIAAPSFKWTELVAMMSWLGMFEALASSTFSATVRGALDATEGRTITGNLRATAARIFATDFADLSVDFDYKGPTIALPLIAARTLGGSLAAHGEVDVREIPAYDLHAVIKDCDAGTLSVLGGALKRRGALVIDLKARGSDAAQLSTDMTLAGSFVSTAAELPTLNIGGALFGEATWQPLSALTPPPQLDAKAKENLAGITLGPADLVAVFSREKSELKLSDVRVRTPLVTLWLMGTLATQGNANVAGSLWLAKDEAAKLIPKPAERKPIVNTGGDLQIPFVLKGKTQAPTLMVAEEEFKKAIAGQAFPTPKLKEYAPESPTAAVEPTPSPAPATTPEKKEKVKEIKKVESPAVPAPAKTAPTTTQPAPAPKKSVSPKSGVQKIPADSADDILKVQIK